MEKSIKQKLLAGFDAIYKEDLFNDLVIKKLSPNAILIKWILISFRDPRSNICDLSDVEIRKISTLHRDTIRKARKELIKKGEIVYFGYHVYSIQDKNRVSTCPRIRQPLAQELGNLLPKNRATSCLQNGHRLPTERAPVAQNLGNPIYTNTNTNLTNRKDQALPVENSRNNGRIQDSELPSLRTLYPFENRENLKNHLMSTRGFTEKQVADTFERVYPKEYTGKAS